MKLNLKHNYGGDVFVFLPSGGLRGRFWLDFGAILETLWSFGATMGDNLGERAWRIKKTKKISKGAAWISHLFDTARVFYFVLAAAAQARTLKNHVFAWRVLHFSLVRLFARSEKKRVAGQTSNENATRRRSEKHAPEHHRKTQKLIQQLSIWGSKFVQKRVRKQLPAQTWLEERLGRHLGSLLELFSADLGSFWDSNSEQKRAQILERFSEAQKCD